MKSPKVSFQHEFIYAGLHFIHYRTFKHPESTVNLILVHGLGGSSRDFIPTAKYLAQFYNIYIPDLPGFGKSSKPSHIFNVPELADALYDFVQSLQLKSEPVLLGNSFGCQVIIDCCTRYPKVASSAVLIGPTVEAGKRKAWQQILGWRRNSHYEPFEQFFVVVKDYLDCGIPRLLKTFKYAMQDAIETKLSKLNIPVLVVRGGSDQIISQQWAEKVVNLLPHGKLVVMPGKGHTVNYNSPKEFADIVHNFLS